MIEDFNNSGTQNDSYAQESEETQKGMSIASMILGIVGGIAWCYPIAGYPVSIAGIVLGVKGMKKGGRGMAIAGFVMCIITLVLTLVDSMLEAFADIL